MNTNQTTQIKSQFVKSKRKGRLCSSVGDRLNLLGTKITTSIRTFVTICRDDHDEAIDGFEHLGSHPMMKRAFTMRSTIYITALFLVGWYGVDYERSVAFILSWLLCVVVWHTAVGWIFVLSTSTILSICECILIHAPAYPWRYRITIKGTVFAQMSGIPMWAPVLQPIMCVCMTDLLRVSSRLQLLLGAHLPFK
jgi:hypothetical protein